VGLGENFAGFMHLADHDEALVNSRIWTEASHIEERLTDLTEHMENVIQYLRNEFHDRGTALRRRPAEPYRSGGGQFPRFPGRPRTDEASPSGARWVYTMMSVKRPSSPAISTFR
jgi:hypothetical protein